MPLRELIDSKAITVKPKDKGDTIVVMDSINYDKLYCRLPYDPNF